MGEAKRRREATDRAGPMPTDERPSIGIFPLILDRMSADGYRPDKGCIAAIVDDPDYPLVAIQITASALPGILINCDRAFRKDYEAANDCFWGGFRSWCNCEHDPVEGMPADVAQA